jgi:hypothetical protein
MRGLVHVKVVSFSLELDGRAARLGVMHDLTEQLDTELRAGDIKWRYRELLEERQREGRGQGRIPASTSTYRCSGNALSSR